MRVHHLNCATMCPPFRPLVNGDGSWLERGHLVCHCLLIESPAGLLLVDTGLGRPDVRDPVGRLGAKAAFFLQPRCELAECAYEQVRARGFAPEDVRHVVVTHLDLDHAGGLADFPQARVHLAEAEHLAATRPPTRHERGRYRACQWAHSPDWAPRPPGGERWRGFEGVQPLMANTPDVLLVPLVGHTRGHTGVAVRTSDGWLLHAGDAYFHREELAEPPRCPPALAVLQRINQLDAAARLANQARLRALAATGEVRVICSHDPVELARERARQSGASEN